MNDELYFTLLKDEIAAKGHIRLTVTGDSMLPTIKGGTQITVVKTEKYNINDIIVYCSVFRNKTHLIAHRVIFIRQTYILAKGDNNNFVDPLKIPLDRIIGKVHLGESPCPN